MITSAWKRGLTAGGVIAIAVAACVSHVEEPEGDVVKATRAGPSDLGKGPCYPPSDDTTAGRCYVADGPPNAEPGRECLAIRSYTRDPIETPRIQYRQTWSRSTQPPGNAIDLIYSVLALRGQVPLPECHMPNAQSGYILLTDWDRSNPDITQQTVRTGFANFVGRDDVDFVLNQGMLLTEFIYTDPAHGLDAPGFHARPVLARRVEVDFEVPSDPTDPDHEAKLAALRARVPDGEGIVYIDEDAGTFHGYSPLAWVVVFEQPVEGNPPKLIAIPIRDAETRSRINDPEFPNCQGRFRGDVLDPNAECVSDGPSSPQWGCMIDEQREDPADRDVNLETGGCPAGFGPNKTVGHFRILDLEKIYNNTLAMTLCVSYMGSAEAVAAGWADPSKWGNNCSGSPLWNPADPVKGLPRGDWCTKTNSPATDDCHDAWLSVSYSVSQAFPVYTGDPCAPEGYPPPPGSNIKSCAEVVSQNR